MQPLYLICGVSGSGKSWVCEQLQHKFTYIPHDKYYHTHAQVLLQIVKESDKPVITECPFAERVLREELEKHGVKINPYFVIEDPEIVRQRYFHREKKPIQKAALTRAVTIRDRAREWNAPSGKSQEILALLKEI